MSSFDLFILSLGMAGLGVCVFGMVRAYFRFKKDKNDTGISNDIGPI